jgi:hypothetical protein
MYIFTIRIQKNSQNAETQIIKVRLWEKAGWRDKLTDLYTGRPA